MVWVLGKKRFFDNGAPTTLGLASSIIHQSVPREVLCLSQHAPFYLIWLKWREFISRPILDKTLERETRKFWWGATGHWGYLHETHYI